MNKITIDFETRSRADLSAIGAWAYSLDPSTEVTCVGWGDGVYFNQWRMGRIWPKDTLFDLIHGPFLFEAHNAFFEMAIWNNVCVARMGWPEIDFSRWRCSAAKAALNSLPRDLENAGAAMRLKVTKDTGEGKSALTKIMRPRRDGSWEDDEATWQTMLRYNETDVLSEIELSDSLPEMSAMELEVWRFTERMNMRGFHVDVPGARMAVKLAGEYARRLTGEFQELTDLDTAGQRAKFIVWLAGQGTVISNTQAGTLDKLLASGHDTLKPRAYRAITIVRELGMSSIKKYRTMLGYADPDGRVRGGFLYCGAAATGRHAGRGVQPQNFPRAAIVKDPEVAWAAIHQGSLETLELMAPPIELLSGALRGCICAPPGRRLIWADFAQIEARDVFWLAGEERALEVFRSGRDMYCVMAATIYGRVITKADELERFLGKQAVLALGFGAGYVKFLVHCRTLGAPAFTMRQSRDIAKDEYLDMADWIYHEDWHNVKKQIPDASRERDLHQLVMTRVIVNKYRRQYKDSVIKLWRDLENAFKGAIRNDVYVARVGKLTVRRHDERRVQVVLPSGRPLTYWDPKISDDAQTSTWKSEYRANTGGRITYMGHEDGQWATRDTYGGKLTENAVQASARDIMVEACLRLERHPPYDEIVGIVHDEVICEVDANAYDMETYLNIMRESPSWCMDLPIEVEGKSGKRYRK